MTIPLTLDVSDRKRIIWKIFTKNFGISITSDILESLLCTFENTEHPEQYLKTLAQLCKKHNITLLNNQSFEHVISKSPFIAKSIDNHSIPIIEYFSLQYIPRYSWNHYKKKFEQSSNSSLSSLNNSRYLERYHYLKYICESNHSLINHDNDSSVSFISSIAALSGTLESQVTIFGMISISKSGSILLEDPYGVIILTWTSTPLIEGIIVPGSMVLITGHLIISSTKRISVTKISQPPFNESISTLIDPWETSKKIFSNGSTNDAMIVISDIYLDDPIILSRIEKLFNAFNQNPPNCTFVFMGSFKSPNSRILDYPQSLKILINIISSKQHFLKHCNFLIIPDLCLPMHNNINLSLLVSLAHSINEVANTATNNIVLSNPARIRYQSKYDILFVKYPHLRTFSKNNIFPPNFDTLDEMYTQILLTCNRQHHLFPFSHDIQSHITGFDQGMLVPNPDIVSEYYNLITL